MAGLVRVERENWRDDWTIVELDAIGRRRAGRDPLPPRPADPARGPEARRRPVPRRLRRRGRQRRAVHAGRASCATARSVSCTGRPTSRCPRRGPRSGPTKARIRQARPVDANALMQLYAVGDAGAGPAPRGVPDPGLGAPGLELARPPELARPDPALRRPRRLRPGERRRRAPRCVHPDRRRPRGPAALPAAARAARGRPRAADRLRARHDRRRRSRRTAASARITASSRPCEPTSHRPTDGSRSRASPRSPPSRCS